MLADEERMRWMIKELGWDVERHSDRMLEAIADAARAEPGRARTYDRTLDWTSRWAAHHALNLLALKRALHMPRDSR